jgi:hypothetical protein
MRFKQSTPKRAPTDIMNLFAMNFSRKKHQILHRHGQYTNAVIIFSNRDTCSGVFNNVPTKMEAYYLPYLHCAVNLCNIQNVKQR